MSEFRLATLEDYRCLHPDKDYVPPLVTDDGDVSAVGTAHGRTVPVIGSTRPPVYDVSLHPFDGGKTRVYGDDPNDVLAAICGEGYQRQLMYCRELAQQYDELVDDDPAVFQERRRELNSMFGAEITVLGYIRGVLAHTARAVAQKIINDHAKEDGHWEKLDQQQKDILESAADRDNPKAPIGVLRDTLFPDPNRPGESFIGKRGTWTADVPLVLNEADYYPWSNVPRPLSSTLISDANGVVYEDSNSELNLRTIHIENADELLQDLADLHVIELTIRPAVPVDPLYREGYEEAVDNRVAFNRNENAESVEFSEEGHN